MTKKNVEDPPPAGWRSLAGRLLVATQKVARLEKELEEAREQLREARHPGGGEVIDREEHLEKVRRQGGKIGALEKENERLREERDTALGVASHIKERFEALRSAARPLKEELDTARDFVKQAAASRQQALVIARALAWRHGTVVGDARVERFTELEVMAAQDILTEELVVDGLCTELRVMSLRKGGQP